MKRIAAFTVLFVFVAIVSLAMAHPPSDIVITYDPANKTLQAVIIHPVGNPKTHFIKKVDVSLNGKEVLTQSISRQDNNNSQTVSYVIPDAKETDELAVEAYCSMSGKLEKEIRAGA
jgi:hypothetical protein